MSSRRVVVTGMGCVSPIGSTVSSFWKNALEGRSGAKFNAHFEAEEYKLPVNFSCQVSDFDPSRFIKPKQLRRFDIFIAYALVASGQAVDDAGLAAGRVNPETIGTLVGTGIGGIDMICRLHKKYLEARDFSRVTPFFVPGVISNMASGEVSIRYGFQGPSMSISSACSSGSHAIGESMRMIQSGRCEIMVCGGTEAAGAPLVVSGFASAKALSRRNDDPERASRPFDIERDGFVLGEGAAIVVLEELEHALKRGATIYAECLGYGANADAHHITSPMPGGEGAANCMKLALKDARLNPDQIDYVNAHGTSTPLGDVAEVRAIHRVFGDHANKLAVSSTKSMVGHLLGASGSLEAIACIRSIQDQKIHPTINVENQDPECNIDCVNAGSRDHKTQFVLSNSFGFGGTNASLIFSKV